MIPEALKQRFKIRTVYAVSRCDNMLAFGFPCVVLNIKYIADPLPSIRGTINIMCRDIFNAVVYCVQLRNIGALVTFKPERREHIVITMDAEGVLTNTDDATFGNTPMNVALGDRIYTLAAPVCLPDGAGNREWGVNRIVEKIMPGAPISPEALLDEIRHLEA